ncbi:MAG: hypothetical protein J1E40_02195 [Oscillospiraceae bacterium]|nr:hypothetical protein [Oscillospiraceae bacterium]
MKKYIFIHLCMCVAAIMMFTSCYGEGLMIDDILDYSDWYHDIKNYSDIFELSHNQYKKIDLAHKEAFNSAFENIEIFGAKLCLPVKVSELPDNFELYYYYKKNYEYIHISKCEPIGKRISGGIIMYSLALYYDSNINNDVWDIDRKNLVISYDICVTNVAVVCKEGQSIEDGIIVGIEYRVLSQQPVLLGGKVDISSDIEEIEELINK